MPIEFGSSAAASWATFPPAAASVENAAKSLKVEGRLGARLVGFREPPEPQPEPDPLNGTTEPAVDSQNPAENCSTLRPPQSVPQNQQPTNQRIRRDTQFSAPKGRLRAR